MFNKQAQSILLRSFSNPILKYKPSPILLCFSFLFFFSWLFFLLFLFPFSSFSARYVPYFSSTGTQPDKYWFTFSAILFKYMSLKSEVWSLKSECHDCNKIFETQRLQTLPPASMQRPTAQRDGGGKFEKGNLVNGNVWQRDEDQLAEGGERIIQLTI